MPPEPTIHCHVPSSERWDHSTLLHLCSQLFWLGGGWSQGCLCIPARIVLGAPGPFCSGQDCESPPSLQNVHITFVLVLRSTGK